MWRKHFKQLVKKGACLMDTANGFGGCWLSEGVSKVCFVDAFVYRFVRIMRSCVLRSHVICRFFAPYMSTFLRVSCEC